MRELGLTNFALEPTREIVEAGVPIATTQVQLSLLDRRVETSGLRACCVATGIQILPYGALAGGLLSDLWLGQPQPPVDPSQHETRSLTKWLIVDEAGGWGALQALLRALRAIADGSTTYLLRALASTRNLLPFPVSGKRGSMCGSSHKGGCRPYHISCYCMVFHHAL